MQPLSQSDGRRNVAYQPPSRKQRCRRAALERRLERLEVVLDAGIQRALDRASGSQDFGQGQLHRRVGRQKRIGDELQPTECLSELSFGAARAGPRELHLRQRRQFGQAAEREDQDASSVSKTEPARRASGPQRELGEDLVGDQTAEPKLTKPLELCPA